MRRLQIGFDPTPSALRAAAAAATLWVAALAGGDAAAQAVSASPTVDVLTECRKPGKVAPDEYEFWLGTCVMERESIGPLRVGLEAAAAEAGLGCPVVRGREAMDEATGDFAQTWTAVACGIELAMSSEKKGGSKRIAAITARAPNAWATSRGVAVGATEADARAAYAGFLDEAMSEQGEVVVVGSVYAGLIFRIENGRVSEMFLGAAAE